MCNEQQVQTADDSDGVTWTLFWSAFMLGIPGLPTTVWDSMNQEDRKKNLTDFWKVCTEYDSSIPFCQSIDVLNPCNRIRCSH